MKLRNKKTGEIKEFSYVGGIEVGWCDELTEYQQYSTLSDLNDEWEDYKPAEPLIKDEKIRKAVRAWAEANTVMEAEFEYIATDGSYLKDYCGAKISFYNDLRLTNRETYTIAELCGEEEE